MSDDFKALAESDFYKARTKARILEILKLIKPTSLRPYAVRESKANHSAYKRNLQGACNRAPG